MKGAGGAFRNNRSGQLLIVAALAIALLISSTTLYVYEHSGQPYDPERQVPNDFTLHIVQSIRNTVVSSLANASNGGSKANLAANLNRLSQAFRSLSQHGSCNLSYTVANDSAYDSGISLQWNSTVLDASSAFVAFDLTIRGISTESEIYYSLNVTTALSTSCTYALEGMEKHVNLICKIYNEGQPALARNMTVFYEISGSWTQIIQSNLSKNDYGNGTYLLSFTAPPEATQISASMHDTREILVQAIQSIA